MSVSAISPIQEVSVPAHLTSLCEKTPGRVTEVWKGKQTEYLSDEIKMRKKFVSMILSIRK